MPNSQEFNFLTVLDHLAPPTIMLEALSRNHRQEVIKTWQDAAKNHPEVVTNRYDVPKTQHYAN